jgi:transposase-like protein
MHHAFTSETAREYGRKGNLIRWSRVRAQAQIAEVPQIPAAPPQRIAEDSRKERVMKQLDKLDEMLDACKEPKMFIQLTAAKERLWNLVFPKPGSLRPKQSRQERASIQPIQPLPIDPTPAIVVPEIAQHHNSENVQS